MTEPYHKSSALAYHAIRAVLGLVARSMLKLEIRGRQNMPAGGPLLIVVNHLGFIDPVMPFITFPWQMVPFVADKWRYTPGVSWLVNALGGIWVTRGEADMDAIKAALNVLKSGGILGMAPEGMRSPTHALQPGKPGAAYLADRARVPVLPVAYMGTENFGRNLKRLRRTPIKMTIGAPFSLPSSGRAKSAELAEMTELIMLRLAGLLEPQYRGVYAEHPGLSG